MPRSLPASPSTPVDWIPPPRPDIETLTLHLLVITPLFGGGAMPRVVDQDNPIRAAAIRGHLRYWWRATVGAKCKSAAELFNEEEQLWGSVEEPSKVTLRVVVTDSGKRTSSQTGPNPRFGPQENYFLWPFNENKGEGQPEVHGLKDVRFTLSITFPLLKSEEVKQSLRAWLLLGGVGSRTRRGCGALTVENDTHDLLPPSAPNTSATWLNHLAGPTADGPTQFTRLSRGTLVFGTAMDAMRAWKDTGTFWARLHKGHFGSQEYKPMSGGKWHDYKVLKEWRVTNAKQIALVKPYWGLPLNYNDFRGRVYAPKIQPLVSGRMASPVILKPVAFADGTFRPMVAVLSAPPPQTLEIDGKIVDLQFPTSDPLMAVLKNKQLTAEGPQTAVIVAAQSVWYNHHTIILGDSA